jgi:hypothetical protein
MKRERGLHTIENEIGLAPEAFKVFQERPQHGERLPPERAVSESASRADDSARVVLAPQAKKSRIKPRGP